jgi:hypothetical protein
MYTDHPQGQRDYPDQDYDSLAIVHTEYVSPGCRYQDYPDKYYGPLVTALAFLSSDILAKRVAYSFAT